MAVVTCKFVSACIPTFGSSDTLQRSQLPQLRKLLSIALFTSCCRCFMADIYGALFAAVAPIVIFLGAAIYFFTLLYTNTERKEKWSKFDDFYLECDNGAGMVLHCFVYSIGHLVHIL